MRQLVAPQVIVQQNAMHEQRDGTFALFRIGNFAGRGLNTLEGHVQPSPRKADALASRKVCAHSSQQTSTTWPPIVTVIAVSSSLQSQAAQLFSSMKHILPCSSFDEEKDHFRTEGRYQDL
jgi:hypothetical protein